MDKLRLRLSLGPAPGLSPGPESAINPFFLIPGTLFLSCLVVIFLLPRLSQGNVTCHCFRDRTYEPSQPASADPYILATARNSFLAAASGTDKGTVVRQRMTGASETDLWLSLYLSTRVDNTPDDLIIARDRSPSWALALDTLGIDTGALGPAFQTAREENDPDAMARALAEPVLGRTFNAGDPTLSRLRRAGADIAEAVLSLYLGSRMKRTPEVILKEVRESKQTWGSLFHSLGTRIDTVGDLIAEAVKARKG